MTPKQPNEEREWERIAGIFHATYEHLAPSFKYKTRPESAVAWEMVSEDNRRLMTATVATIMPEILAEQERRVARKTWEEVLMLIDTHMMKSGMRRDIDALRGVMEDVYGRLSDLGAKTV